MTSGIVTTKNHDGGVQGPKPILTGERPENDQGSGRRVADGYTYL